MNHLIVRAGTELRAPGLEEVYQDEFYQVYRLERTPKRTVLARRSPLVETLVQVARGTVASARAS